MGYLIDEGKTMTWKEVEEIKDQIKRDGIIQFLHMYKLFEQYNLKKMHEQMNPTEAYDDNLKRIYWGEEIESHLVRLDHQNKRVQIVPCLKKLYNAVEASGQVLDFEIHPEYGNWMIETVPKQAYSTVCSFSDVVKSIRGRSKIVKAFLAEDEHILQAPVFGMLGVGSFVQQCKLKSQKSLKTASKKAKELELFQSPSHQEEEETAHSSNSQADQIHESSEKKNCGHDTASSEDQEDFVNEVTQSRYIDDRIINPHPRFPTLARNIRERRGENVDIQVPLFIDEHTSTAVTEDEPHANFISMDAMAFGMGSCCLQTTFSAIDFTHGRWLYDQLSILNPMLLAATAGSCFFKGKLADVDTRWDMIAASVDCRNEEERDPTNAKYIPKSRYSSISQYVSNDPRNLPEYDNYYFPRNKEMMEFAEKEAEKMGLKLDEKILQHLGFLFIRDPLVVFDDRVNLDNTKNTAHFENIQSTNWNSMRLKLPPSHDSKIGWRVEFRSMELQLTDDENAAFAILVQVFVRMLYEDWFKLNLYIPMDKNEENFRRATKRDAILNEKFHFRINIYDDGAPVIKEMTIHQIFFGAEEFGFKGLAGTVCEFMTQFRDRHCKDCFSCGGSISKSFEYLKKKTTGERKTLARWQRDFLVSHPEYKKDSIVNDQMSYDLYKKMIDITYGNEQDANFPKLFD